MGQMRVTMTGQGSKHGTDELLIEQTSKHGIDESL